MSSLLNCSCSIFNQNSILLQYYDAIHVALTYTTESTEPLVDDVWALGDDWWVQEGTTAEDEDEHYVRKTSGDELCMKMD
jgi:hypothetical protein